MKAHLLESAKKINLYTSRALAMMASAHGVELLEDPEDADVILVSTDDPDDLPLVKKARRLSKGRPVVAGGFESFGGEYLLAFVDAVNVGEGFDYFRELGKAKNVEDTFDLPYVLTPGKKRVEANYNIDMSLLPLVRTGKRAWYYLAGRGCRGKCAFCETSFAYPRWSNLPSNLNRAMEHVEGKNHRLTFITNDSSELTSISKTRVVQSVRIDDFLKTPSSFVGASMLHFGIEGFSKEHRKYFAKAVPDYKIYRLIELLDEYNQTAELFFITGLPNTFEAMMEFAEFVPPSPKAYARFFMKFTRLDPSPHTPLWTYDLRELDSVTPQQYKDFYNAISGRNKHFRHFPIRGDAKQVWRPLLRRCEPHEVELLGPEPHGKDSEEEFLASLDAKGLSHLITYDGRPLASSQMVIPWRNLRDRMADKRGMIPINYKSDGVPPNAPVSSE